PGDRTVQRGARPRVPDPSGPGRRRAGAALLPQARAQRLPVGDAPGLQLPDRAAGDARADAAEALPPSPGGPDALPVAPGEHAHHQPLGPVALHLRLRRPGRLALAGLLRDLARDRRMASAGGEVGTARREP